MKHIFLITLVSGFIFFQSCGNSSNNNDSVENAKDVNEEKADSNENLQDSSVTANTVPVQKEDADFAVEAANGSMMEVEMGRLAESKAVDSRVKNFAAMMVTDHSKASEDLMKIASAKNITLPSTLGEDAKKHMQKMTEKSGTDFDKAYMDMMLDDHKKDIKKFEDAAKTCKDAELKTFASQTLPVLYKHLDSVKLITNKK